MGSYRLEIEARFSAAHAIEIKGEREPLHGHDWHVTAIVESSSIGSDGLVADFHDIERALQSITGRFHNQNLNETAPFDRTNPTAEFVARHIFEELERSIGASLHASGADLARVRVTEAPGCAASYGR